MKTEVTAKRIVTQDHEVGYRVTYSAGSLESCFVDTLIGTPNEVRAEAYTKACIDLVNDHPEYFEAVQLGFIGSKVVPLYTKHSEVMIARARSSKAFRSIIT